jgi:hypothetical protein
MITNATIAAADPGRDPQASSAMTKSAGFLEHKMATITDVAERHKTTKWPGW